MVLSGLMDKIVEEGGRFAATSDMKVADMSNQAPVGTTLAILERTLKVMSAVQARVHYSMKQELPVTGWDYSGLHRRRVHLRARRRHTHALRKLTTAT